MPLTPQSRNTTMTATRAKGRVTLADVARLAGVSPITVSRALRGERAVDAELVARAKEAAQRLGYVPDPAARALASRHSSHVGVLVPMLSNALFVDVLEAVQRSLRPEGFQTLIGITHYDAQEEEQLLEEQLQHRPVGLLVTGLQQSNRARLLIERSGVPCIHMMELIPPTEPSQQRYSVGFSQEDAAAGMTQHLLSRGHTRIAFAGAQLDARTLQRSVGWKRAMTQAGLPTTALEWLNPAASTLALGGQIFEQILAQSPRPQAIFFGNDDLAQGALLTALRLGLRVPHDIAIAGFNDLVGSAQMLPPLTTVRTPRSAIGETASRMLLALLRGEHLPQTRMDLGFEIVIREST
jgi:LacI family transcriptional regulator, gluconate utilization system Gnt-I transcriptional repressor